MAIGKSAGILMYKRAADGVSVLLVHPGGPFWSKRDNGAWSIPKGEYADAEQAEAAARREFAEELGPEFQGRLEPLGEIRQKAGKLVVAFAAEGEFDTAEAPDRTPAAPELAERPWREPEAAPEPAKPATAAPVAAPAAEPVDPVEPRLPDEAVNREIEDRPRRRGWWQRVLE